MVGPEPNSLLKALRLVGADIYRDLGMRPPAADVQPFSIQDEYLAFRSRADGSITPAIVPGVSAADRRRLRRWNAEHKEWGVDPVGWDIVFLLLLPVAIVAAIVAESWNLLLALIPVVVVVQAALSAIPRPPAACAAGHLRAGHPRPI